MPPPDERGPNGWEITIVPGPLPLEVRVTGLPPVADEQFGRAIWAKINHWSADPEHLSIFDRHRLEKLRARLRDTDSP